MLTRTNIDEGCTVASAPDVGKHLDGNPVLMHTLNFIQAKTFIAISATMYAETNDILHSIIVVIQKKKSSFVTHVEKDSPFTNKKSDTIVTEL